MTRLAASVATLAPPVDVDGPRVRLGLAWAAVSFLALAIGPLATAVVFAAIALGAAGQSVRSWKGTGTRPYRPVAVGGAVLCGLAGSGGPVAVVAAAVVVVVAAVTAAQLRLGGHAWDARSTVAVAVVVGLGAASPALVRGVLGLVPALVLVAGVHVVDAAVFVVGSGARSRWEGPAAAVAGVAVLFLGVAAVFVPPFRGASPVVLGLVVAVLAPAGPLLATALLGRRDAAVPALRRLDAFLVVGPVWALAARVLLDVP